MASNSYDTRHAAEYAGVTLTQARIAEVLSDKIGLNGREAKELVGAFFEEIRNALVRGEPVKLYGFGNFLLRVKAERPGRNPKTREEFPVKSRRVVTFRVSRGLKSRIELNVRAR